MLLKFKQDDDYKLKDKISSRFLLVLLLQSVSSNLNNKIIQHLTDKSRMQRMSVPMVFNCQKSIYFNETIKLKYLDRLTEYITDGWGFL